MVADLFLAILGFPYWCRLLLKLLHLENVILSDRLCITRFFLEDCVLPCLSSWDAGRGWWSSRRASVWSPTESRCAGSPLRRRLIARGLTSSQIAVRRAPPRRSAISDTLERQWKVKCSFSSIIFFHIYEPENLVVSMNYPTLLDRETKRRLSNSTSSTGLLLGRFGSCWHPQEECRVSLSVCLPWPKWPRY